MYTLGIDFGTESGRAVLVDVRDGREVATAVHNYSNGVIDQHLPGSDKPLPPDWALQDPQDYIEVFKQTIPAVLQTAGVRPEEVVGIGIDFTACTMMPVKADGTPLCALPEWRDNPHAWVKLWKHHAAQPEADQINETARRMGQTLAGPLRRQDFVGVVLQQGAANPERSAGGLPGGGPLDRSRRLGDLAAVRRRDAQHLHRRLQGDGPGRHLSRRASTSPRSHPDFADVVDTKMQRTFAQLGDRAGGLTAAGRRRPACKPGIAVAVANVDAHVTAPAVKAIEPGQMVMIMGTSTCHMVCGDSLQTVEGMCGVVDGGIIPGLYGYEAGQSGVGDIFAWFVDNAVAAGVPRGGQSGGHGPARSTSSAKPPSRRPGEHGLLALDWWNGNRSMLVDVDLTGLLIGATLATRAPDIYRALIEATAYGTRIIIEAFESQRRAGQRAGRGRRPAGEERAAAADLRRRDRALDPARRVRPGARRSARPCTLRSPPASTRTSSAAAETMGKLKDDVVEPIPENAAVYDKLYAEYKTLYDYFGRGENDVMKRLKQDQIWRRARDAQTHEARAKKSASCTRSCPNTTWSPGRAATSAGATRRPNLVVIKPSGIKFEDLTPEKMVRRGHRRQGRRRPTTSCRRTRPRTATSTATCPTCTAWCTPTRATQRPSRRSGGRSRASRRRWATSSAGRSRLAASRSSAAKKSGEQVVLALKDSNSPACILQNHGVFATGPDAEGAVKAAVMTEDNAAIVWLALQIGTPLPIAKSEIAKLHYRYQNVYGQ